MRNNRMVAMMTSAMKCKKPNYVTVKNPR